VPHGHTGKHDCRSHEGTSRDEQRQKANDTEKARATTWPGPPLSSRCERGDGLHQPEEDEAQDDSERPADRELGMDRNEAHPAARSEAEQQPER
jgi:hypothetical protein